MSYPLPKYILGILEVLFFIMSNICILQNCAMHLISVAYIVQSGIYVQESMRSIKRLEAAPKRLRHLCLALLRKVETLSFTHRPFFKSFERPLG